MKSEDPHQQQFWVKTCLPIFFGGTKKYDMVWYSTVEFNVPLDTGHFGDNSGDNALSSDVHLSFSNGGPAT